MKKAISIFLTILMLLSCLTLLSACGGSDNEDPSSDKAVDESDGNGEDGDNKGEDGEGEDGEGEDGEGEDGEDGGGTGSKSTGSKNTSSKKTTSKKTNSNSSKKTSSKKTTSGSGNTGNGGSTTKYVFSSDYLSNISSDVKSKGIHILMWREYDAQEKILIANFEKKTGIKIRTTTTTQADYTTKMTSLIAGSDAPDIALLTSSGFPGVATRALNTLNEKTYCLDDPIWSKTHMNAFKVNGKYFGVSIAGAWNCEDTNYLMYYFPSVLKDCGITTDPYTLYKQGRWNQDELYEMAKKAKAKNLTPITQQRYDLPLLATGASMISYDGTKFTNELNSVTATSNVVAGWQYQAKLTGEGLTSTMNISLFAQKKAAFWMTILYMMNKNGDIMTYVKDAADMKAVPIPGKTAADTYVPVEPKLWANCKNSKNPEGAAIFLRYFLDPANMDMNSTFVSDHAKEVYKLITGNKTKKNIMVGQNAADYVAGGKYNWACEALSKSTTANIYSTIQSNKSVFDTGIKRANADLAKIK